MTRLCYFGFLGFLGLGFGESCESIFHFSLSMAFQLQVCRRTAALGP